MAIEIWIMLIAGGLVILFSYMSKKVNRFYSASISEFI